jgi:curved DNA-binding protein CbpA
VKQVHPDLHPDDASAAARFRGLHEAYEALTAVANRDAVGQLTDAWEGQF